MKNIISVFLPYDGDRLQFEKDLADKLSDGFMILNIHQSEKGVYYVLIRDNTIRDEGTGAHIIK